MNEHMNGKNCATVLETCATLLFFFGILEGSKWY